MASATLKYSAVIISSLIIGGAVAIGISPYFASAQNDTAVQEPERKVLFWYDPMKPDTKFDKPGKSPFMDMDLVPKYADEEGGGTGNGVRIDPVQQQNLGLKTAQVRRGTLDYIRTFPANVMFNDYQFVIVQARAGGFIEKVYPLTTGDRVRKGMPLIEITVPEWVEAQSEYLLLKETGGTAVQQRGVLERLRLAGMPENHIRQLQQKREIQTRFTITAPIDGVLTAFDLKTGMNIGKENIVAKIQGIDPIWLTVAVPESLAYLLDKQADLRLSVPSQPDKTFKITRRDLLAGADPVSRTLQLRLQVENPEELLKPGMNAYLTLTAKSGDMLLIPSRAVIDTGSEQRVITQDENGKFVPKKITVLRDSGGDTGIGNELREGEKVVVNGLFLIDSEANINGALERMRDTDPHSAYQGGGHD
ncbi:efflux RND transporter periplasmic adaptor subunit [Morganella psychrotolerans]|uniref:Efflux RND transporter periplasmic adaptor subunit n=1 Tax=Morganella psychrotolerans TaxID=368603 RepID=A0A5M9RAE1_9GAMM|nr:efflux RND transporter periplasmic adaptor subunit [Morganella psychrotolerans]KAA8717028.1 efflux RND transporter periplasmic adaptor subunit [Morganella psychrotolerans]OBU08650.1 efflux transporter periplasmic adaptor subunit [Morganella psychrotolerans]